MPAWLTLLHVIHCASQNHYNISAQVQFLQIQTNEACYKQLHKTLHPMQQKESNYMYRENNDSRCRSIAWYINYETKHSITSIL